MVKVAREKPNKPQRHVLEEIPSADYNDSNASTGSSNINSNVDTANATLGDDVENADYPQQSNVWKYATKLGPEKASCNMCNVVLSRKGQSTSSVRRHLRSVHKMTEFEEKHVHPTTNNDAFKKLSIDQKRKLQALAVNAIVEDGRSFNDLNKPGIAKLFNGLLDGFRAPHRNTVKKNIKRLNTVHTKRLMTQLSDANFIAITTDFWCDRSTKSYLCMTGHWYNNEMILKSKVLVLTPYFDRHTSQNISSELEQRLKQLKIFDKTTTITCDGASNIKASFKRIDARIRRLQCLAHKLHLVVCNALGLWVKTPKEIDENESAGDDNDEELLDHNIRSLSLNELNSAQSMSERNEEDDDKECAADDEQNESDEECENDGYLSIDFWDNGVNTNVDLVDELQTMVGVTLFKCRSIIKMINKSTNLTSYVDGLKEVHDVKRTLSIDCKSRWNSTAHMITSVLKHKGLIGQLHSDKHDLHLTNKQKVKLANLELSSDEWVLISSIEEVLQPFHNATKLMSGQKYPTIGTALFAIRKIKAFFESYDENNPFINGMKDLLVEQLIKYIDEDTEQLELIVFLAYFDPLGFSVLTQKERTTVERDIKQLLKGVNDDSQMVHTNRTSQTNTIQTSALSSMESSNGNSSTKKSTFSLFLHSVSTDKTKKHSITTDTNKANPITDEFLLYKSLALKEVKRIDDTDSNPDASAFWQVYGNQLPQLKYLAKRYLCTPATSVPSESAFSVASNLGRRQRARLLPNTLAMTVFLKDKVHDAEN